MFVYSYKFGSKSARTLAKALGCRRIKHKNSRFRGRNKVVINWGSSSLPESTRNAIIINRPEAVARAANKLSTFEVLSDARVDLPKWSTTRAGAENLLEQGNKIFCRTKLTGHSGEGIVIAETTDELVDAPLYTVWHRINKEYRVHVFDGKVIHAQRKARKREVPDAEVNWKVRNLKGGFIFAMGDCDPSQPLLDEAVKAVVALGLDFGAVDIIDGKDGVARVLEVNTACGLEGTTIEKYVEAFNAYRV